MQRSALTREQYHLSPFADIQSHTMFSSNGTKRTANSGTIIIYQIRPRLLEIQFLTFGQSYHDTAMREP